MELEASSSRVETRTFGQTTVSVVGDRIIIRTPFWAEDDEPDAWQEALTWAGTADEEVDFGNPDAYFYDDETDEEVYTFLVSS